MPRGNPGKKRGRRKNGEAEATAEVEVDEEGNPIVSGESEEPPSLGEAVEIVRSTLAHFETAERKRVLRAASMLLK